MLELILGPSGSGKSYTILQRIRARALEGKQSILIVPEQFTSTTERRLYAALGDALSGFVTSYSFSSLSKAILEVYGGAGIVTLNDADRAVLIRRALADLGDKVQYYKKQSRSVTFCQLAGETINEFKSAGITHEKLALLAENAAAGKEKLSELALIYAAYEARLANTALDPTDRVELAARRVEPDFFRDTVVYLDEFDTFNVSKRTMLGAILPVTDVVVGLCCTGEQADVFSLFSGAATVCQQLRRVGHRAGVEVKVTTLTGNYRHKHPDLQAAAALLMEQEAEPMEAEHITLLEADDRRQEAEIVAALALRLNREEGIPFSNMAIICRDPELYLSPLRYQFRLAGVPLYSDGTLSPAQTAPAMAAKAAIELLRGGLTTTNLMALARTGLCALTPEQQQALESYAFAWEPLPEEWAAPLAVRPDSYGNRIFPTTQEELDTAEAARRLLVEPALRFRQECRGAGAAAVTHGLYRFLDAVGTEPDGTHRVLTLAGKLRAEKGQAEGDRLIQQWAKLMELLDSMERLLGEEVLTAAQYAEHFDLLLKCSDLGTIPQMNESVILTGAGRMRLDGVRAAFVLGLTEGEFPQAPTEQGLLIGIDRDVLLEADARLAEKDDRIELPDCFENKLVREQICFYRALTVASERLLLSYPGGRGEKPVSAALEPILAHLHPKAPEITARDRAATRPMAVQEMGRAWNLREDTFGTLHAALGQDTHTMALAVDGIQCSPTDKKAIAGVLGQEISLSPSKLEQFYHCPFGYFMNYMLRLQPRRKARLTADQGGNLIHWVLEQIIRTYAERWQEFLALPPDSLNKLAADLTAQYIGENLPGIENRPQQQLQVHRMEENLARLLVRIQEEFAQTDCRPVACELEIGSGGQVRPLSYEDGLGHTVRLVGKVDRVDMIKQGETAYIRVVDYKTGDKEIDLDEVNSGVDCQMLYYLSALEQQGFPTVTGEQIDRPAGAGVLYLLVDPRPDDKGRVFKTKGLLLENEALLLAMDTGGEGKYLPVKFNKDGSVSKLTQKNLATRECFARISQRLTELITQMAQSLYEGRLDACPLLDKNGLAVSCQYCDYRGICGHIPGENERNLIPNRFRDEEVTEDEV